MHKSSHAIIYSLLGIIGGTGLVYFYLDKRPLGVIFLVIRHMIWVIITVLLFFFIVSVADDLNSLEDIAFAAYVFSAIFGHSDDGGPIFYLVCLDMIVVAIPIIHVFYLVVRGKLNS